jgi:predicted small lipoprotein YifL
MRTFIVLLAALFALGACHREGPAEKAGRQLDQAGRDLKDAVNGDKK